MEKVIFYVDWAVEFVQLRRRAGFVESQSLVTRTCDK